jgi:hypothetical protein
MKDGKITVVEHEAEQVRLIYRRYLELSGVNALVRDLKERNMRTKKMPLATGGIRGGIPFERGTQIKLLSRSRFARVTEARKTQRTRPAPPAARRAALRA